jgi:hypothetical protein
MAALHGLIHDSAPAAQSRPTLGVALDTMWSIKDYFLSGAVAALSDAFRIVAWLPEPLLADTRKLADELGLEIELRPAMPYLASGLLNGVCALQRSLLYERFDVNTERVMRKRESSASVASRSPMRRLASGPIRLVAKSPLAPLLDAPLDAARERLTASGDYERELDCVRPNAILITDPVRREFDGLYYGATARGIPVAALVLSWDNVTAKGRMHPAYSRVLVWNAAMHAEVERLYPRIERRRIVSVGFPRFDVYRGPLPEPFTRGPFLRSLGLDPALPVILFANSATRSFRTQPEVIEHICVALESGALPRAAQLLIRCHPHDEIATYERFRGRARIALWPQPSRGSGGTLFQQVPQKDELLVLAATIRHCAVCVNPGSTVMLDAALADVPVACVAYDGDQQLPYWQSYRSCYEYTHQQAFHQLGATDVCYSRDELIASIARALTEPTRKAAERKQAAQRYLGGDERSVPRLRAALLDMMAGHDATATLVPADARSQRAGT